MKKTFFAAALCCLLAAAAFAQTKPADFSGTWTLDISKSKLDERSRVESMTLTVLQTAKDIRVESKTTRAPRPEGAGGAGGGRGGFGGGDSVFTYTLDGKEAKVEQESRMGKIPVTLIGKFDAGTLNLSSSRTFEGQMGTMTLTTKETWTLSPDGTMLTVVRENQTPRGSNTATLVFVKK